jgi:hypothetical protein
MKPAVIPSMSLLCAAICVGLIPQPASADVIYLTNGRQVEGELLPLGNGKVRVRLASGSLTLRENQIAEVQKAHTPEEIAEEALAGLAPDDADGVVELAHWARGQGSFTLYRRLLREAVERDPDHGEARRALGYHRHEDRWVTEKEFRTLRGEVRFRGEWVSASTRDAILQREAEAVAARAETVRERIARGRTELAPEPRQQDERREAADGWDSAFGPVAYVHHGYGRYGYGYGYAQPLAPFRIGQIQLAHPGHHLYLRPIRRLGHHPGHPRPGSYALTYPNQGIHRVGIGVIGGHHR